MKKYIVIICLLMVGTLSNILAQTKKTTSSQPKPIRCHLPCDSLNSSKVTFEQALAWADSLPLIVIDDKGQVYKLQNFSFSVITMNPMQTKDYGIGNGGIPLLARKAMNNLKPKDTVFLKDITAQNEKLQVLVLANIVFSIKE